MNGEIQGLHKVRDDVYYLEGQVEALTLENHRLKQEQGEKEAEKERWRKRCRTVESSERREFNQKERIQAQLEDSERQLATRERIIREYQAQIQATEHAIDTYRRRLQEKEEQANQSNAELHRLTQIVKTLQDGDRRKDRLIETYHKMYEEHQKCKAEARTSEETIQQLEAEKHRMLSYLHGLGNEGLKLIAAVKEAYAKIRDASDLLSPFTPKIILEDISAAQQALQPYVVTRGARRSG